MILSIGPFNIIFLAVISVAVYLTGFYFLFKNKLGFIGVLSILFFPILGSLGIILYSLAKDEMCDYR